MNANLIIFLREFKIFSRAFILNVIAIFGLAILDILNPLPFLMLIPAFYFIKVKGTTPNSIIASLLFVIIVMPFKENYTPILMVISLLLILYLQKHYSLRECSWASWTLGSKFAFCLYINGFNILFFVSFLWFALASIKEMKINKDDKPPFDIIPKNN